jgi:hypothetical protein
MQVVDVRVVPSRADVLSVLVGENTEEVEEEETDETTDEATDNTTDETTETGERVWIDTLKLDLDSSNYDQSADKTIGQRIKLSQPVDQDSERTRVNIYVYADNGTIISNEDNPIILNIDKLSEDADINFVTINPSTDYENTDSEARTDENDIPNYTVFANEDSTNPNKESYTESFTVQLSSPKATFEINNSRYTPDEDGNVTFTLNLVERDENNVFHVPAKVYAEAGNSQDYIINVELHSLDIGIESLKYNTNSTEYNSSKQLYYVFEDSGTSNGLLYIQSTSGTTITVESVNDSDNAYNSGSSNELDENVTFDSALGTSFKQQDYKITVHASFGTYEDGSVKEYTKEYTFSAILKDNNTALVLYVDGEKIESSNGIFEASISYEAKQYELKAEAESEYALVGIETNPPTNLKVETVTVLTPNTDVDTVKIYVTAQDGTVAPYPNGADDGGYYTLIVTRKNEVADLEKVTTSNIGAEVEYDEELDAYVVYTSDNKADVTAVLTAQSTNATVSLWKYEANNWVVQTDYTNVDANMSAELGEISKSVNNGEYQIRVRAENTSIEKSYKLQIKSKSSDASISAIVIEEGKPGEYNSQQREAVWDAKVPARTSTIKIVPRDKHATITNVVRVVAADSSASETTPAKQPVTDNQERGTIVFDLEDGVKIDSSYYEYYRITVVPQNGGTPTEHILRLQGEDDD